MSDPTTRAVTLQWLNNAMAGDELLELWLKDGAWSLDSSIAVSPVSPQSHVFALSPGTSYSFQIRARREGSYRSGYTSSDPEDWPSGSRLDYTTGLPKPVVAFAGWARTSSTDQHLSLAFSNVDTARAVRVYRDAGGGFALVQTVGAGTLTYDYPIGGGESGLDLVFYIDQLADDATSNPSDQVTVYAGIEAPTMLEQIDPIGPLPNYGYTAQWALGHAGAKTRVSDHWTGVYQDRVLTAASALSQAVGPLEQTSVSHTTNHDVSVIVRVQHELTSFTVTDVSEWVSSSPNFSAKIYDDETAYNGP